MHQLARELGSKKSYFIELGNSYDLAKKIILLLNDKGKSRAMYAESARIAEYDVSIAKKIVKLFLMS